MRIIDAAGRGNCHLHFFPEKGFKERSVGLFSKISHTHTKFSLNENQSK